MSAENNKALVLRYIEEHWNQAKYAVADELIAPDFVNHDPFPGQQPGPEGVKFVAAAFHKAFPDYHATVKEAIAEGDMVALYMIAKGTHRGPFRDIAPTGRVITLRWMDIFRLKDGKISEREGIVDSLSLMQQLGVLPTPGQPKK